MPAPKIVLPLTAFVLATTALVTSTGSGASAPIPDSRSAAPGTPNDCIRRNGGDYNACNAGGQGRGDLPYGGRSPRTPDECIRINGGDYNACNVGNQGRGDLPYLPVH